MSDLHRLPLLGHDLPESVTPKASERRRVRVFSYMDRGHRYWAWAHPCDKDSVLGESRYLCWEAAQCFGAAHARKCC